MQISFLARTRDVESTRKLSLKKETLRQLTDGELRMAAGGGSIVSLTPSVSVISGSTSTMPSVSLTPSVSVSAR